MILFAEGFYRNTFDKNNTFGGYLTVVPDNDMQPKRARKYATKNYGKRRRMNHRPEIPLTV